MAGWKGKTSLVFGSGINDAGYSTEKKKTFYLEDGTKVRKHVWHCPYYVVWRGMIERCFSVKTKQRFPTYTHASVHQDWLYFSKFKSWMETQDWEGKYLDKDILSGDDKFYSPETCYFVTRQVNNFMTESNASRTKNLIGTTLNKDLKFKSQINNPFTNKRESLGNYFSELEAHFKYCKRKLEFAVMLSDSINNDRVKSAFLMRYQKQFDRAIDLLEKSADNDIKSTR